MRCNGQEDLISDAVAKPALNRKRKHAHDEGQEDLASDAVAKPALHCKRKHAHDESITIVFQKNAQVWVAKAAVGEVKEAYIGRYSTETESVAAIKKARADPEAFFHFQRQELVAKIVRAEKRCRGIRSEPAASTPVPPLTPRASLRASSPKAVLSGSFKTDTAQHACTARPIRASVCTATASAGREAPTSAAGTHTHAARGHSSNGTVTRISIATGAAAAVGKQHTASEDTHVHMRGPGAAAGAVGGTAPSNDLPPSIAALAAVFDGHGGSHCSRYLKRSVVGSVATAFGDLHATPTLAGAKAAAAQAMHALEDGYRDAAMDAMRNDGSCGVVAIVMTTPLGPSTTPTPCLVVAHVGDCRAMLFQRTPRGSSSATRTGRDLTVDHRVSDPKEMTRVVKAGMDVEAGYCYTGDGSQEGLAVTRSFGDRQFKMAPQLNRGIIAEPTVASFPLGHDSTKLGLSAASSVLVLCSDGITDVMTCDDVAAALEECSTGIAATSTSTCIDPQEAAQKLLSAATAKGTTDDATVVVMVVGPVV